MTTTATTTEATISEAQRKANQANAQASTGPRTPEGKAKSRMNAFRHGLTGQFSVMSEDDERAYKTYETGILEALAPVGTYERDLAICIAQNRWRLHRARALESNILGLGHHQLADDIDAPTAEVEVAVTQAQTWLNHHHALTNMTLYESRIERTITHNKRELDALQATRKAAEAQAREEAELLIAAEFPTDDSGLIPTPAAEHETTIEVNGFVFSTTKIIASLNHKTRVAAARRSTPHPIQHPLRRPKAA